MRREIRDGHQEMQHFNVLLLLLLQCVECLDIKAGRLPRLDTNPLWKPAGGAACPPRDIRGDDTSAGLGLGVISTATSSLRWIRGDCTSGGSSRKRMVLGFLWGAWLGCVGG
mmetsp:Transcript_23018/g.49313  ORF Transcript_23018/g.49313 Transcript_23018/m.49313 type:complete len:112 (+) Transcript_23018:178-513(+)